MTIRKGEAWGSTVTPPDALRFVATDAAAAAALTDGTGRPVALTGGDLHRTVGARNPIGAETVLALPIDLLTVTLDARPAHVALAHVLVRSPWWRGGWWRGPVVMVMNAEFVGDWHVADRGHPNDGRAESCSWGPECSVRQRWEARRRLPTGRHVPHPLIETRSFHTRTWEFRRPMHVRIDGVGVGRARRLEVSVVADAATVHA